MSAEVDQDARKLVKSLYAAMGASPCSGGWSLAYHRSRPQWTTRSRRVGCLSSVGAACAWLRRGAALVRTN